MTFDWTFHISDVALAVGLLVTVVKLIVSQDRINNRFLAILGTKDPPDGLLGDVEALKSSDRRHHEWLILLRGKNGS